MNGSTAGRCGMPRSVVDPKASGRPAIPSINRPDLDDQPTIPSAGRQIHLDHIIGLPVVADDQQVGTVADVVVNESLTTVMGVDLSVAGETTAGEPHTRFLPWFQLRVDPGEIRLLIDEALARDSAIGLILGRGRRLSESALPRGVVVTPIGDISQP
jgi:PRC-barrel domain